MNRKQRRASSRLEKRPASWKRAIAHIDLGDVLFDQGRLEESEASYRRALKLKPDYAVAHNCLGNVLCGQGRWEEAEASRRYALKLQPDYAIGHYNLGKLLRDQGELDEAEASYRRALELLPDFPEAHNNLGNLLSDQGRSEESEASYRRALQLRPDHPEALNNLGNVLRRQGKWEESEASYRRALQLKPDYLDAHYNLGVVLQDLDRLEESEASYRRVLKLEPAYAKAHNNLGIVLKRQKRLEDSETHCRRAIELDPNDAGAHHNLWITLLAQGKFSEGWEEHEWRWQSTKMRSSKRNFSVPQWDGDDLHGRTVLLHAEQGFGDTIQFIRYAAFAASSGAQVVVECPAALINLLQGVEGIDSLVARGSELPPFDLHCPLLSLPKVHGTTLETIPSQEQYITSEPKKVAEWAKRIGGHGQKVGIAWAGNPEQMNDRNRSLGAVQLQDIIDLPDASFMSLQVGDRASDVVKLSSSGAITDLAPYLTDFSETAAAICNLDLVIAVDTAVAHLAGALGKPVWVMLSYSPDWRWLLDRDDSPWYPTMKLYRQDSPGDWRPVLDRIRADLIVLSQEPKNERPPL